MTSVEKEPGADESPESCPELDDEYFAKIAESFDVVDVWEEKSNDETVPKPAIIKKEPRDPSESRSSRNRRESDRSSNNRDPKSRDRENDKRSKSPDRNRRSPPRRPSRFSPPGRRRLRSRTPPRHNRRDSPPRRNNQTNRPSFLEEITKQIPEIKQDMMRNQMQAPFNNNAQFGFGMPLMMQQNHMMSGQGFMPGTNYMQPQQFQNVPMHPFVQQQQQFPMNQFNNINQQPMIPGQMSDLMPVPVPAPMMQMDTGVYAGRSAPNDPRIKQQNNEQQKQPEVKDYDLEQAKKKAFDEGKIGLSDYLRQVSRQTTRNATVAELKSKREKVQERCKNAAKLLDELGANKTKLPFVLCPSSKNVPAMKSDARLEWKSPLVMSDHNAQFFSQAKIYSCRDAFQANPLRNISGKLFQFTRNLGLDMVTISQQVRRQVDLEREKELQRAHIADISKANINTALKKSQRSTQTDINPCTKCEKRESIKFCSKSSQVEMPANSVSTQYEPESESFSVSLNARIIQTMSQQQHNTLAAFCLAFDINDPRFKQPIIFDEYRGMQVERDDRMVYSNPENPNTDDMYVSLESPARESPPRSPKRRRITERLGQKIQSRSPLRQQFYDDDIQIVNQGPSRHMAPYQPLPPYHIPSPPSIRFGRDKSSPYSSRTHRNRSRSRSKSQHLQRRKSRSPPVHRRGRY